MLPIIRTKNFGEVKVTVCFTVSSEQDDLFSPSHVKYDAVVRNKNSGISKRFSYQCNGEKPPKMKDLLYCLILDSDYSENIASFEDYLFEFGYTAIEVKDLKKHKKSYMAFLTELEKFAELFNQEEVLAIRRGIGDDLLV